MRLHSKMCWRPGDFGPTPRPRFPLSDSRNNKERNRFSVSPHWDMIWQETSVDDFIQIKVIAQFTSRQAEKLPTKALSLPNKLAWPRFNLRALRAHKANLRWRFRSASDFVEKPGNFLKLHQSNTHCWRALSWLNSSRNRDGACWYFMKFSDLSKSIHVASGKFKCSNELFPTWRGPRGKRRF